MTESWRWAHWLAGYCLKNRIYGVKNAQLAGAVGVVVVDNESISPTAIPTLLFMNDDASYNKNEINIPSAFMNRINGSFIDMWLNLV
ncbi:hypothetical protein HZS_5369 [Henneguya salminicola]|nr:hypothetical protein HZS_5369 [Henneguya salminicola]